MWGGRRRVVHRNEIAHGSKLWFYFHTVRHVRKDEKKYYEELLRYSREHLMLYPYHLSDVVVKGLRVTPFAYYISIMSDIMTQEKSYDSLPNFTAADCKFHGYSHLRPRSHRTRSTSQQVHANDGTHCSSQATSKGLHANLCANLQPCVS